MGRPTDLSKSGCPHGQNVHLKLHKLENLISINKEDYIDKALYLSENLKALEELRLKIFKNILNTPLFESKIFSIDFQNKLLDIYKKTNHKII